MSDRREIQQITTQQITCERVSRFLSLLKPRSSEPFSKHDGQPLLHNVVMTMKFRPRKGPAKSYTITKDGNGNEVQNSRCVNPHYVVGISGYTRETAPRFLSNTFRIKSVNGPLGTGAIFSTGTNSVGSRNEAQALLVSQSSRLHLVELGYDNLDVESVFLHNKVFSGSFGHGIDIYRMAQEDKNSIICKDSFPGLIYFCVVNNRISVLLIFWSGNYISILRDKNWEILIHQQVSKVVAHYKCDSIPSQKGVNHMLARKQVFSVMKNLTEEELQLEEESLKKLIVSRLVTKITKSDARSRKPIPEPSVSLLEIPHEELTHTDNNHQIPLDDVNCDLLVDLLDDGNCDPLVDLVDDGNCDPLVDLVDDVNCDLLVDLVDDVNCDLLVDLVDDEQHTKRDRNTFSIPFEPPKAISRIPGFDNLLSKQLLDDTSLLSDKMAVDFFFEGSAKLKRPLEYRSGPSFTVKKRKRD